MKKHSLSTAIVRHAKKAVAKAPPAASKPAVRAPRPSKQGSKAPAAAPTHATHDVRYVAVPVQIRPSMEALSEQASKNLAKQRAELVKEINIAYARVKYAEVKRLALEVGYTGLVIAEITVKEEQVFMVKDP